MIEIERRKSERWIAKPGVLLEYRLIRRIPLIKGRYRLFGTVMDLSAGGLAVEYADRKIRPMEKLEYALSAPNMGLRLEGLEMQAVSDFVVTDESSCGGGVCRRRGFRFGQMSREQHEILRKILQSCSDGPLKA
ncbi:MAG: hypothetical protein PVG78_05175 [Desulfobacterales bacterium]|jgi:hypothetical protein